MAHPDHDAIIDAFRRVGGTIYTCDRADPNDGYTHIHGPSFRPASGATRCMDHAVVVEKHNGTVSPRDPVGVNMQGCSRTQSSIKVDPLGHSHRNNYGAFHTGFDVGIIRTRWRTLDDFAREVIAQAKANSLW
jgi:hypothetical protein